jgi:hypothetical protein
MAGEQAQINDTEFLELFSDMDTDFVFRFESGSYDALKTSGLDRISNDSLRAQLITTYDNTLPAFKVFIERGNDERDPTITRLSYEILSEKLTKNESGEWEFGYDVAVEDVLQHPSFIRILMLESQKAQNQRRRLDFVISVMDRMIDQIASELDTRK